MEQPMLVLLLNSSSLRTCPNAADGLVGERGAVIA